MTFGCFNPCICFHAFITCCTMEGNTQFEEVISFHFFIFLQPMFFIIGILFKVQHWPGAGIMIALAVISAVLFLVPSLLVTKLRDTGTKEKKPVYVVGAIGIMIYITGSCSRYNTGHWPAYLSSAPDDSFCKLSFHGTP